MFCSKCGNPLKDSDRFCTKCGAPVVRPQMPQEQPVVKPSVPQERPAAEPVYAQASGAENAGARPVHHRAAASVQKKSKKGLIIGLSLGGVLLVLVTVVIMFASGLFNPAPSSPFPVLKVEQTQIYYGEDLDQLEEAFPNMEKNTEFFYSLKQSGDQRVRCLVRADKETGETKLVCWTTDMDHTGIANRISIGDSYERILAEYPDAMCSTEVAYGAPRKHNPETDSRVSFVVYMDENGNTYSHTEYEKKRFDSIREQGNFDLAKWYGLYFTVENGRITMIDFGDLGAIQQGR